VDLRAVAENEERSMRRYTSTGLLRLASREAAAMGMTILLAALCAAAEKTPEAK
jgi:hypothetical protein